jgi:hypothetical protein
MKTSLLYLIFLALPAYADTSSIEITKSDSGSAKATLFIELIHTDGSMATEFRPGEEKEVGPGPWFGRALPRPAIHSPATGTWMWENLAPGTYEIRFQSENSSWIIVTGLEAGVRKEMRLPAPGPVTVQGALHNNQEPVKGLTVSVVSRNHRKEDRIFWKSWTTTDAQGRYRLPVLPSGPGEVDAQAFLDDRNPRTLAWENKQEYVSGTYFRGEEIWAHTMTSKDPKEFQAGISPVRLCTSSLKLNGENKTATVFVKMRPGFDYRFRKYRNFGDKIWKKFRSKEQLSDSLEISGLPEGEILLVLGSGKKGNLEHTGITYQILTLPPGETLERKPTEPTPRGSVAITLENLNYEGEQPYARLKRNVILLPKELKESSSYDLAEAFSYAFPWKEKQMEVKGVQKGAYFAWTESSTWFDTLKAPAEIRDTLPLGLLSRALRKKINEETISPDHAQFEVMDKGTPSLTFRLHRGK